jgi:hypothetical protein
VHPLDAKATADWTVFDWRDPDATATDEQVRADVEAARAYLATWLHTPAFPRSSGAWRSCDPSRPASLQRRARQAADHRTPTAGICSQGRTTRTATSWKPGPDSRNVSTPPSATSSVARCGTVTNTRSTSVASASDCSSAPITATRPTSRSESPHGLDFPRRRTACRLCSRRPPRVGRPGGDGPDAPGCVALSRATVGPRPLTMEHADPPRAVRECLPRGCHVPS